LISEVSTNLEKDGSRENLEVSSAGFRHAATAKVSAERDEMLKSMGAPSFLDAMEVRFPNSPANFWNVLAAKSPTQRIISSAGQCDARLEPQITVYSLLQLFTARKGPL
jgi:hypothetical protein